MAKKPRIRVLALALFRQGDYIFVGENVNPDTGQVFYRPIGGGVEFGERAKDALAREIMEETGAEVRDLRYLCTLENVFEYLGNPGHEICLLFDGVFVTESHNALDTVLQGIDDGEVLFDAMWKPIRFFQQTDCPLYPDDLLDYLLTQKVNFD